MMRYAVPYLFYSLLGMLGIFLQAEVFSFLEIFHAKPDFILIFTVIASIKTGWKNGGLAGAVMGFWLDVFIGSYFGINIIVFGCTGMLFGFLAERIKLNFYPGHFFSVCMATVISGLITLISMNLIGLGLPWLSSIAGIIFPTAFYNALLMLLAMPSIYLYRRFRGTKIGYVDMTGGGIVLTSGNTPIDKSIVKRKKSNRKKKKSSGNKRKPLPRGSHSEEETNHSSRNRVNHKKEKSKAQSTRKKKKTAGKKRGKMKEQPRSKGYERP